MADMDTITLRSGVTAQALATMGADPQWDARLATYLSAEALQQADQEFGKSAKAEEEHNLTAMQLEAEYGREYRQHPRAVANYNRLMEAEAIRSDKFLTPVWQAQRELVLTPAPTLAAAMFKNLLIQWEEVWNDCKMPRDCFEIIAEDFARLAGEAVSC